MPFIKGRTLQEAIDPDHGDEAASHGPGERRLRLRGMLQSFIVACNTQAGRENQSRRAVSPRMSAFASAPRRSSRVKIPRCCA
jgi:hypothetical protein